MKRKLLIIILPLILLFASCAPPAKIDETSGLSKHTPTVPPPLSISATSSPPSQEVIIRESEEAITPPKPTASITPFIITAEATITPTSSFTPTTTFTPSPINHLSTEEKIKLMDILNGTQKCKMPCWNGITPGISQYEEMIGFWAHLGYEYQQFLKEGSTSEEGATVFFSNNDFLPNTVMIMNINWSHHVIQGISVSGWGHPEQYKPNQLFKALGVPGKIYGIQGPTDGYLVAFTFPEKRVIIEIVGKVIQKAPTSAPDPFWVCLGNSTHQSVNFALYSPEQADQYLATYSQEGWFDWSEELSLSTENFAQKLVENPSQCFPYKK